MGNSAGNSWVRLECCLAEKKRIRSGISESFLLERFFLNVKCCLISKHIYIYKYDHLFLLVLPNNLSLISSLFGKFLTIPANHGITMAPFFDLVEHPHSWSDFWFISYNWLGFSGGAPDRKWETQRDTWLFWKGCDVFFSNKCDVLAVVVMWFSIFLPVEFLGLGILSPVLLRWMETLTLGYPSYAFKDWLLHTTSFQQANGEMPPWLAKLGKWVKMMMIFR